MAVRNIRVIGDRMEPRRIYAGTRGSYITEVAFTFSGEWDGLTKKLIFYPVRGKPVYINYTYGSEKIPYEVMRYSGDAIMLMSGYSVEPDGSLGVKIVTASAFVAVDPAESDTQNEPDIPEATEFEKIVAKLGAPYIGENGNWFVWDVYTHEFVDTGLPARGEQGETGRGLTILGKYGSLDDLRASVKDAQPGDAYAVGEKAPYTIYIWDDVSGDFTNHGDLRGVGITKIEQITDNTGSGEPNTIRIYTDDGVEYDYTVYNGERGHPGNIWIGETEPPDDSYTIWMNPGGAVSGFLESHQGTENAGRVLTVGEDGIASPQYPAVKEWTKLPTFYKEVMTSGDFYVDVVKLDISKDLSDIPLGLYYDSGVNDSHGEKPYYYGTGVRIVDGEAKLRQLVGTGPLVNINMITDEKIKITFFGADLNPQVIYTFDRTNRTLDASWIDSLSRLKTVELLKEKVDIDHGTENAGRVLVVGDDGIVRPGEYAGGGGGTITEESDPTVPAWAKQPTKPTYTAAEVGALSESELDSAIDSALAEAKESGEFDGGRGAMILNVTSWPLVYTTETNSLIKYRSPISTVLAQSGASDVKAGDIVWCGTYHYSVLSTDDTYAYMGAYTFIQGAPGKSAYAYAKDGGYTGTEEELSDDLAGIAGKITAPATASVGQTIKVSAVDADGKPTAWEAVDTEEVWELLVDVTLEEEINYYEHSFDVPQRKLKVIVDSLAASANTTHSGFTLWFNNEAGSTYKPNAIFYPFPIPQTKAYSSVYNISTYYIGDEPCVDVDAMAQTTAAYGTENDASKIKKYNITGLKENYFNKMMIPEIFKFAQTTYGTFAAGTRYRIYGVKA